MIERARTYFRIAGLRGLVLAALGRLLGRQTLVRVRRRDVRHPFFLRVPSSDAPTYDQVFFRREYDFVAHRTPEMIVDAGANIGLVSLLFANLFPEARILAIEPASGNFEILRANVAPYPNVEPIRAALWDAAGEVWVHDPGRGHWGFVTSESGAPEGANANDPERVAAVTVDQLMSRYDIDHIDILKVDIEGAERNVFRDTSSWIGRVDALIVELHDYLWPGCARAVYNGSNGFDAEWQRAENVYLTRTGLLSPAV